MWWNIKRLKLAVVEVELFTEANIRQDRNRVHNELY